MNRAGLLSGTICTVLLGIVSQGVEPAATPPTDNPVIEIRPGGGSVESEGTASQPGTIPLLRPQASDEPPRTDEEIQKEIFETLRLRKNDPYPKPAVLYATGLPAGDGFKVDKATATITLGMPKYYKLPRFKPREGERMEWYSHGGEYYIRREPPLDKDHPDPFDPKFKRYPTPTANEYAEALHRAREEQQKKGTLDFNLGEDATEEDKIDFARYHTALGTGSALTDEATAVRQDLVAGKLTATEADAVAAVSPPPPEPPAKLEEETPPPPPASDPNEPTYAGEGPKGYLIAPKVEPFKQAPIAHLGNPPQAQIPQFMDTTPPKAEIKASVSAVVKGRLVILDAKNSSAVRSIKWYIEPSDSADIELVENGVRCMLVPQKTASYKVTLVVASISGVISDATMILPPHKEEPAEEAEPEEFASSGISQPAVVQALALPKYRARVQELVSKMGAVRNELAVFGGSLQSVRGSILTQQIRSWDELDRAVTNAANISLGSAIVNIAPVVEFVDQALDAERGADMQRLQQVLYELSAPLTEGTLK